MARDKKRYDERSTGGTGVCAQLKDIRDELQEESIRDMVHIFKSEGMPVEKAYEMVCQFTYYENVTLEQIRIIYDEV